MLLQLLACINEVFNTSQLHSVLRYQTQNYSVVFNETAPQTLLIDVTYEPRSPAYQQLAWRHSGRTLNVTSNPRTSIQERGRLFIDPVRPSDAGDYDITAIISNDLGCETAKFTIYIECKSRWLTHSMN